jgi:metal transporter CNNM
MTSFQSGRSHILLVSDTPGKDQRPLGVVTLEDVVEVSPSTPRGFALTA